MEIAGGQELMPALQPKENWQKQAGGNFIRFPVLYYSKIGFRSRADARRNNFSLVKNSLVPQRFSGFFVSVSTKFRDEKELSREF